MILFVCYMDAYIEFLKGLVSRGDYGSERVTLSAMVANRCNLGGESGRGRTWSCNRARLPPIDPCRTEADGPLSATSPPPVACRPTGWNSPAFTMHVQQGWPKTYPRERKPRVSAFVSFVRDLIRHGHHLIKFNVSAGIPETGLD